MKTEFRKFEDRDCLSIFLKAENAKDVLELAVIIQSIRKPVDAFGGLTTEGAYAWINIPLKKNFNPKTDFSNG